uniref:Uncharacterized protein n=1 Tax=Arundo donax TaxID=35708 RepID=A0A0A9HQN3_ARUDO
MCCSLKLKVKYKWLRLSENAGGDSRSCNRHEDGADSGDDGQLDPDIGS